MAAYVNDPRRVLVLGASGLLGGTLVPFLRDAGHSVTTHARSGKADVTADISDADQIATAFRAVKPEVIVNLVALTDVDACERDPREAFRLNVRTVSNLVAWMQTQGSPIHLIHVSTDQVYDGPGPHSEPDVSPSNYYGYSKYAAELVAATVPCTVVRTNFFGPSRCPGRRTLSDWIVGSLRDGRRISVFTDVQFSPLALATLSGFMERMVRGRVPGTFNVGSRDGMSKADFAFALARGVGLPDALMTRATSDTLDLTAYRPSDMRMDCTLFETTFGVRVPTLAEEINSTTSAYVSHS
jgi:dTDP-4-dehydrorhamnose reductase